MARTNVGDPNCPPAIEAELKRITAALGSTVATNANPCGTVAYYDADEQLPWIIADDGGEEAYKTAGMAFLGAAAWIEDYQNIEA